MTKRLNQALLVDFLLLPAILAQQTTQPVTQPGTPARPEAPSTVLSMPAQIGSSDRFGGSVPTGEATTTELALTLDDALSRALRYNLALVEGDENVRLRRAERLH